jgi:CubicO group peptidase (beta-lactamase class C family)
VGFILLGLMIEQISGLPYREYIRRHGFEPLGMHHTGFMSMDGVWRDVAEGYIRVTEAADATQPWRKNIYSYPPLGSPDSGAYATASDLDIFIRSLYRGGVLSAELTQALFTPQVAYRNRGRYQEKLGFGFHFFVDDQNRLVCFKKDGDNPGVSCILSYYPAQDVTLAVLANQDCDVWQLSWEIHDLILTLDAERR